MQHGALSVRVNNATVVQADIPASNGLIHAIDTVLMPADLPHIR
ncbi:fasciclin domain-containing protein [Aquidulcibacter sp.]